jgi:hypothetical protein
MTTSGNLAVDINPIDYSRIFIEPDGNIGIGTMQPSYKLDVVGTFRATGNSLIGGTLDVTGAITSTGDIIAYYSSDINLKTNLATIKNPINKLEKINGYSFDWVENKDVHNNEGKDYGIIAQEIEEILPELVITRDNGYKAVKYEKIIPLLIEAIKELNEEIKILKNNAFTK